MSTEIKWGLAIHGGAGVIARTMDPGAEAIRLDRLRSVLASASSKLADGLPALDVVEHAVVELEEAPEFNAGHGAVLDASGQHELEAAIMDGQTGDCGATLSRNPLKEACLWHLSCHTATLLAYIYHVFLQLI